MVLHIKACHLCEESVRNAIKAQKNPTIPFTEKKVGRAIEFTVQMVSPSTYKKNSLTGMCLNKLPFPYHEARRPGDKDTVACSSVA